MATPSPPLHLFSLLSGSNRIIKAHSRHFLALSVLFLLPLSFSFIVFPTLQTLLIAPFPNNSQAFVKLLTFSPRQHQPTIPTKILVLALAFALYVFVLALCALASITYSVFHGFYGRPVKLISAIKSISASFLRLLGTFLATQIVGLLVFLAWGLLVALVGGGLKLMGVNMESSSPFLIGFIVIFMIPLVLVVLYLQVNWILASVVVVVESTWGFQALTRSANLIKGMRGVALSLVLFFLFLWAILAVCSSDLGLDGDTDGWKSWLFVARIVVSSIFLMNILLYSAAANTVLYMYCKAMHGELAMEIAEEFAREYVSLPFDDGKVPHVVSVGYP